MRYISDTGTGADPAARVNACLYQHVSEPSQKQLSKAFVQRSVRQHQRLSKRKKEKCCICSVHLRTKPKDPYRNSSVRIDVPLHPYFRFNKSKWELKSLHTESEIYVRNVFTLKINTTSRSVNHVYVLPPKFSFVIKKFGSGSIFLCVLRIRGKHFDSSEPPYKRTPKSRMAIVKFIHFISQHKVL